MKQVQAELASEYQRIQCRVIEDPGTAGDETEENWAKLLRDWLPANYPVVTKGRIIGIDGTASPQVDILILHPAYPNHLLNKKHYMAGGVIAAFECKLTLRTQHLSKAFRNASKIKKLVPKRLGTPYRELTQPIIFGLLAHSHCWKDNSRKVALSVVKKISDKQFNGPEHPSELLDIICISNLATYSLQKDINIKPTNKELHNEVSDDEIEGFNHINTMYTCSWNEENKYMMGTSLGAFVSELIRKIAYEDLSIRSIADYYDSALASGGIGLTTIWYPDILSSQVVRKLKKIGPNNEDWSEWAQYI